ncbi:MAG: type II secretion system F family protein [Actinobacteria bacterium]|nr:type II secretion system F family protein [Actinomycetota bacterium]
MNRRKGLLAAVLVPLLTLLVVALLPSASSAEDDAILSVRQVDARDNDNVAVTFLYTGDPGDLETMSLREDGVAQKVSLTPMSKTNQRMATVVLIDTSASMNRDGTLTAVSAEVDKMIGDLRVGDHMAIVSFNDAVTVETGFTGDGDQLTSAVADIAAPRDGKRALYAAIHRAGLLLTDQKRLQNNVDTQTNIVVLTDGPDTASDIGKSEVASVLRSSGAALFTVDLAHAGGTDTGVMDDLSSRAGGMTVTAENTKAIPGAVDQVEKALGSQYVATYASQATEGNVEIAITVGSETQKASYVAGANAVGAATEHVSVSDGGFGPEFLRGSSGLLLIVVLVGIAVGGMVWAFVSLATSSDEGLDAVLRPYEEGVIAGGEEVDKGLAQTAILQRAVEMTEDFAERQGFLVKVEGMLERADLPLRAAEALFFYVAALLVLGLGAMFGFGLAGGLLVVLLLALVPPAALSFMASRRAKKFVSQLPDTLHLLSGSLRAGYSLMQGVEAVSQEVEEPMAKELRRVITEARLGREVEDAMDGVAERMQSPDFAWAVMAIRIQREVGGNLAELLNTVAETMVQRERLRREVAALTAEGKISAIILGALPVGLGFFMWLINPEYMKPLGTTGMGQVLLGMAIVSALVGFAWMKKTITIEM